MQNDAPRAVMVAGATGLVGRALLDALTGNAGVGEIHALARVAPAGDAQVQWYDWQWLDADAGLPALGAAFCCLGTTRRAAGSREGLEAVDHGLVLRFARRMRAAGVRSFSVVSSVGASAQAASHYLRVKGRMEQDLDTLKFPALHIHRPSLLLGSRDAKRPAEDLAQRTAPVISGLMRGPLARYRPVPAALVAEQMVQAALSDATGTQVHYPYLPNA